MLDNGVYDGWYLDTVAYVVQQQFLTASLDDMSLGSATFLQT